MQCVINVIGKYNLKYFKKVGFQYDKFINQCRSSKPSKLLEFHQPIGDALVYSISKWEIRNVVLRRRIKESEMTLLLKPLFVELISTIRPTQISKGTLESSSRIK